MAAPLETPPVDNGISELELREFIRRTGHLEHGCLEWVLIDPRSREVRGIGFFDDIDLLIMAAQTYADNFGDLYHHGYCPVFINIQWRANEHDSQRYFNCRSAGCYQHLPGICWHDHTSGINCHEVICGALYNGFGWELHQYCYYSIE